MSIDVKSFVQTLSMHTSPAWHSPERKQASPAPASFAGPPHESTKKPEATNVANVASVARRISRR
jgi:hypothetical protein